jgi:hypothetical protein
MKRSNKSEQGDAPLLFILGAINQMASVKVN